MNRIEEIKDNAVTTKTHDFFTEIPYEDFEWLIRRAEQKEADLIAGLMFAYMNKDEDFPHSFEIEAFERGLYYLQEYYEGENFRIRMFEEALNRMREQAEQEGEK